MMRSLAFSLLLIIIPTSLLLAQSGGEREFDPKAPPEDLRHTSLLEFLNLRQTDGVLPSPIGSLIDELTYADYAPVRVLVPYGRSLQAPKANEQFPRKVIASGGADKISSRPPLGFEDYSRFRGSEWEGRLFFGHAELDNSVEIISWNPRAGRFDFFIVSDYDSPGYQRFIEPARELCVSCHQSESPIFAPQPWSESITHDPLEQIIGDERLDFFRSEPDMYLNKNNIILTRLQTPIANNSALAVGSSSMAGTRLLQASNAVREVCRDDDRCKLNVLTLAMLNPSQSRYIRIDGAPKGEGPLDFDFTVAEANLRTGLEQTNYPRFLLSWQLQLRQLWSPSGFALPDEFLPDMSGLANGSLTPRQVDPRTPRALARPVRGELALPYLYDVAFEALDFRNEHREAILLLTSDFAINTLRSNYGQGRYADVVEYFLEAWPPSPDAVVEFLKAARNNRTFTVQNAQAITQGVSENTQIDEGTADALTLFQSYCAGCHSSAGLPNVPFNNIEQLRQYNVGQQNSPLARLLSDTRPMPPRSARQPSDAERQILVAALSNSPSSNREDEGEAIRQRQFSSHMDTQVMANDAQRLSYITAAGSSNFTNEGRYDPCLNMQRRNSNQSVWAGQSEDGSIQLALENFPTFKLGSITQTFVLPNFGQSNCLPAALTRNGSIIGLSFDREKQRFYQRTLTQASDSPNVQISYISETPRGYTRDIEAALVISTDGNIYALSLEWPQDGSAPRYRLNAVRLSRSNHFLWSKLKQTTSYVYARTLQGQTIRMTKSYRNGNVELNFLDSLGRVNYITGNDQRGAAVFASTLNDPQSMLSIPGRWDAGNRWRFPERWLAWRQ